MFTTWSPIYGMATLEDFSSSDSDQECMVLFVSLLMTMSLRLWLQVGFLQVPSQLLLLSTSTCTSTSKSRLDLLKPAAKSNEKE